MDKLGPLKKQQWLSVIFLESWVWFLPGLKLLDILGWNHFYSCLCVTLTGYVQWECFWPTQTYATVIVIFPKINTRNFFSYSSKSRSNKQNQERKQGDFQNDKAHSEPYSGYSEYKQYKRQSGSEFDPRSVFNLNFNRFFSSFGTYMVLLNILILYRFISNLWSGIRGRKLCDQDPGHRNEPYFIQCLGLGTLVVERTCPVNHGQYLYFDIMDKILGNIWKQ